MSRVNCYVSVHTENRHVSIGGRGSNNKATVIVNTDNATRHDCNVVLRARVSGQGLTAKERYKKDERKSYFELELPSQTDKYCEVRLVTNGHHLNELAHLGLLLASVKGTQDVINGNVEQGIKTLDQVKQLWGEMQSESEKIPNVILPGGVNLAKALAAVKIVEGLVNGEISAN